MARPIWRGWIRFDEGLDGDEVGKRVGIDGREEFFLLPASELPLGEAELTADSRA